MGALLRLVRRIGGGDGLPGEIIGSEDRFRDLLRDGAATTKVVAVRLTELSEGQWQALVQFADVFLLECESSMPRELFPAFHREQDRRRPAR